MDENIQIKIAKLYNASQNCISRIKRGLHKRGVKMNIDVLNKLLSKYFPHFLWIMGLSISGVVIMRLFI